MQRRTKPQFRVFDRDGAKTFVASAIRNAYPVGAAKHVANDIGESHRSAERWVQMDAAMPLHVFLNACQAVPELKAAMRQLLDLGDTDPRFARALSEFVRAAQEMR